MTKDITERIDLMLGDINEDTLEQQIWGILDMISTTNNGKLMLKHLDIKQMKLLKTMTKSGYVRMDSFLRSGDSISWTEAGQKRYKGKL